MPAPAVWLLRVYEPLTAPKLALKSPVAIPPDAAPSVTDPVSSPPLAMLVMSNVSVGESISTTPPIRRSPGVIVFWNGSAELTRPATVDSIVESRSPSGEPARYVEKCGSPAETVPVAASKLDAIATGAVFAGR